MTFLTDSFDLFAGKRTSHMGAHQYVSHGGSRNGRSTSGALLWAEAEKSRATDTGNMVGAEEKLLATVAKEIKSFVPLHTTIVDLGIGTPNAFKAKVFPLLTSLRSDTYVPVDQCLAFMQNILSATNSLPRLKVSPIVDDFFEGEGQTYAEEAVVCSFCSTIGNILAPLNKSAPKSELVHALSRMADTIQKGWLLIALDTDQNGKNIQDYYAAFDLFQLNIFDRMAAELPLENFDPLDFSYEPLWIASSGQLAHLAVVNRDISFRLSGQSFSFSKGHKFHLKNSFKFTPSLFESCSAMANLEPVKIWSDSSTTKVYLLRKTAVEVQMQEPLALSA